MKISLVTVVYNNKYSINDAIDSVLSQDYKDIEYIMVDGASTDGTVEIIKSYGNKISKFISEPDNGIYDAMNKGIKAATGEIIGILNSDDMYADISVIKEVVTIITQEKVDTCYGDLVYVDKYNTDKVIRNWKSGNFLKQKFKWGWMPPHPTFFVKREIYQKYGLFDTNFPRVADYELMLRFLYKFGCSTAYIPTVLVRMRTGGNSHPSIIKNIKTNIECYQAWKVNGFNPNPITFILKPLSKAIQYVKK